MKTRNPRTDSDPWAVFPTPCSSRLGFVVDSRLREERLTRRDLAKELRMRPEKLDALLSGSGGGPLSLGFLAILADRLKLDRLETGFLVEHAAQDYDELREGLDELALWRMRQTIDVVAQRRRGTREGRR